MAFIPERTAVGTLCSQRAVPPDAVLIACTRGDSVCGCSITASGTAPGDYSSTSKRASVSTGIFRGRALTPTAERLGVPASSPNS